MFCVAFLVLGTTESQITFSVDNYAENVALNFTLLTVMFLRA